MSLWCLNKKDSFLNWRQAVDFYDSFISSFCAGEFLDKFLDLFFFAASQDILVISVNKTKPAAKLRDQHNIPNILSFRFYLHLQNREQ